MMRHYLKSGHMTPARSPPRLHYLPIRSLTT